MNFNQISLTIITLLLCISLLNACATFGGSKVNYSGSVKLPEHGNYVPTAPIPGTTNNELSKDDVTALFNLPYSQLFTIALKSITRSNYSILNLNSDNGIIKFKTISGQDYYLKVSKDRDFDSKARVKVLPADGSYKIEKNFVLSIFETINNCINETSQ